MRPLFRDVLFGRGPRTAHFPLVLILSFLLVIIIGVTSFAADRGSADNELVEKAAHFREEHKDLFGNAKGILVTEVLPGTQAEKKGLLRGDIIVKYNAEDIETIDQFIGLSILTALKPSSVPIEMVYIRDGKIQSVDLFGGKVGVIISNIYLPGTERNQAEKTIVNKYGEAGLTVYDLIDGKRTAEEIMNISGVGETNLIEILEFMEKQGIIRLEHPDKSKESRTAEGNDKFSPLFEDIASDEAGRFESRHYRDGNSYLDKKDYQKALESFQSHLRSDPQSALAHYKAGLCFYLLKRYDESLEHFSKALNLDVAGNEKSKPIYFLGRGNVFYKKQDFQAAIADYDAALKIDPRMMKAYYNRGLAAASREEYSKAIQDFSKVIELKPDFAFAYHLRGLCYDYYGMFLVKAEMDYIRALKLQPDLNEAKAHLEALRSKRTEHLRSSEPPKEPILRIEAGIHTSSIREIGTDEKERYLVTGSRDKTVRVWELPSGRLLKVLRPPIGEGNEGKIYTVAISPDGKAIACGGWTSHSDGSSSVYLFDRASGQLIRTLSGFPQVIFKLVFSKNGSFLFVALGGKHGIRVYETTEYKVIAEDEEYEGYVYSADFDSTGRFVTSSDDGHLRLYDKNFKLIKKSKAIMGKDIAEVRFSPDGSMIAIGYDMVTRVDVYSSKDLSLLFSPDTTGVTGYFGSVAWSQDAKYLYAAGTGKTYKEIILNNFIRKWERGGRGKFTDIRTDSNNTITGLLPLKQGGVIFCTSDPAFGIIDKKSIQQLFVRAGIADFEELQGKLFASEDGKSVQFGFEKMGKSPARFSIADRQLYTREEYHQSDKLFPPAIAAQNLNIEDWHNEQYPSPKLNDAPLKLSKNELVRSLAIAPDGESFLLGTEWHLRLFDKHGEERWKADIPTYATAVNIAKNGKVAIAAFGDGTIRWYRLSDGRELLAFFPHGDKKRWVIWTPSGYYDASPGGEDLIGWHINNGKDNSADFYPISKFREEYYRPDVIKRILDTLDEAEAVVLADEEAGSTSEKTKIRQVLPPVVTILSPSNDTEVSTTELTISFTVRTPSGDPVIGVKALVDGRPAATERSSRIRKTSGNTAEVQEINVSLPEKDSEIAIIAENKNGSSEPAIIRVKWKGTSQTEPGIKPKLYMLAIGISKYTDYKLTLGLAAKDARDFKEVMEHQRGKQYSNVITRLITDDKATKEEILNGLDWIQKETKREDVAVIFLAGHGINDKKGFYYFLPANTDLDKLKSTGVPFSDIKNTIESVEGRIILFVDTCHSGNVMGSRGMADMTLFMNTLISAENGAVVFASSSGNQSSIEEPSWGNGAFTKALIEGLAGEAAGKAGKITISRLDTYVTERVDELTKGSQIPRMGKPLTISDLTVIAVRDSVLH